MESQIKTEIIFTGLQFDEKIFFFGKIDPLISALKELKDGFYILFYGKDLRAKTSHHLVYCQNPFCEKKVFNEIRIDYFSLYEKHYLRLMTNVGNFKLSSQKFQCYFNNDCLIESIVNNLAQEEIEKNNL